MRRKFFCLITFLCISSPVFAFSVEHTLQNPALESEAKRLFKLYRCVVCDGQPIDESNATLAKDIRQLIRTQLQEGKKEEEISQFLVSRYGEYVLMKPPVKPATYALWYGPFLLLIITLIAVFFILRTKTGKVK